MIADAVGKIQAIEQQLTEKTKLQLQARLTIRACLKELREISTTLDPNCNPLPSISRNAINSSANSTTVATALRWRSPLEGWLDLAGGQADGRP